jgi:hypothetical protein
VSVESIQVVAALRQSVWGVDGLKSLAVCEDRVRSPRGRDHGDDSLRTILHMLPCPFCLPGSMDRWV